MSVLREILYFCALIYGRTATIIEKNEFWHAFCVLGWLIQREK